MAFTTNLAPSSARTAVVARASALSSRKVVANVRPFTTGRIQKQNRASVLVQAMIPMHPDPDFMKEVEENFPEKMIANVEEARCLIDLGYKYVDVRTELEIDAVGKWKGSVNVPIMNAKWKFDAELNKKIPIREDNPNFIAAFKKKIPNLDTPLLIGCSDGSAYSLDALEALDEAGYTNLVGLKGGYYAWFRVFDNNLRRRMDGEYAETYTHDGDSCGIHSSGAGFARVDAIEKWSLKDVEPKWADLEEATA